VIVVLYLDRYNLPITTKVREFDSHPRPNVLKRNVTRFRTTSGKQMTCQRW